MKTLIFSALFLLPLLVLAPPEKVVYSINKPYEMVIEYIISHEGFSPTVYNDNGYPAIGYGVRLLNLSYVPDTVTKETAESMLRKVFNKNLQYIEHHYPNLPENKKIALAHLSYCIGIGRVLKNFDGINLPEKTFGQKIEFRNFEKTLWTKQVLKQRYYWV